MREAVAQSIRFNADHRIGEGEKILYGFRDGGRGTSFDDGGRALTPYREIMCVEDPAQDVVLAEAIAKAREATAGVTQFEAIDILNDLVSQLMPVSDVDANVRLLAAIDGSNELGGQKISLGQMIAARTGVCRHRSLFFKVLADEIDLPAALVRGNYCVPDSNDGPGGHAWNEVVTSDGERFIVDVMHNVASDIRDPYFASYCTVDDVRLYPEAGRDHEVSKVGAESSDQEVLRNQDWIAARSAFGGRSSYAFVESLEPGQRQTLERVLNQRKIRFDEYQTSIGATGQKQPVIRVKGIARLLLERAGATSRPYA